jgi:hypothetical protein
VNFQSCPNPPEIPLASFRHADSAGVAWPGVGMTRRLGSHPPTPREGIASGESAAYPDGSGMIPRRANTNPISRRTSRRPRRAEHHPVPDSLQSCSLGRAAGKPGFSTSSMESRSGLEDVTHHPEASVGPSATSPIIFRKDS